MQQEITLRRRCLKMLLAGLLLPLNVCWQPIAHAASWSARAFEAKKTEEVLAALGVPSAPNRADIVLTAPQKAENGAVVQVELEVPAAAGSVQALYLLADANPTPLVASFHLAKQVLPKLVTRIKLAQTGALVAVAAQSTGTFIQQRRQVVVLEDGCASSESDAPFVSSMKLRARLMDDGVVELKMIIVHPMRTGRSKYDDGRLVPAHFMQQMQVLLNGELIVDAHTSTAISRNPYFTFYVKGALAGDVIAVRWQDNQGMRGEGLTHVSI